jgi:hypothetical protein
VDPSTQLTGTQSMGTQSTGTQNTSTQSIAMSKEDWENMDKRGRGTI